MVEYVFGFMGGKNNIGVKGVKVLVRAKMPQLTVLNMSHNKIQSQSLKWITKAKWPRLKWLILNDCQIYSNNLDVLSSMSNWNSLTTLSLKDNEIGVGACLNLVKFYASNRTSEIKLSSNCEIVQYRQQIMKAMPVRTHNYLFEQL